MALAEVAVTENVAESGDRAERRGEPGGEHGKLRKAVDRRAVPLVGHGERAVDDARQRLGVAAPGRGDDLAFDGRQQRLG